MRLAEPAEVGVQAYVACVLVDCYRGLRGGVRYDWSFEDFTRAEVRCEVCNGCSNLRRVGAVFVHPGCEVFVVDKQLPTDTVTFINHHHEVR